MVIAVEHDAVGEQTAVWPREVMAALRRLDPGQQRIIRMIYFDRRTQDEVADELSLPRRAVARAAAAGLQRLALLMRAAATG